MLGENRHLSLSNHLEKRLSNKFRQPLFYARLVYLKITADYFSEISDKSCRIQ